VKDEHREAMRETRRHLRAGELHEAEHFIEEMLAGKAKPEPSSTWAIARRQSTRFGTSSNSRKEQIDRRARLCWRTSAGDLHEAEHGIADLLGMPRG
jgi:hypothetical protein